MRVQTLVAIIMCQLDNEKTQRKCRQYISEENEAIRKALNPTCGNLGKLGSTDVNLRLMTRNHRDGCWSDRIAGILRYLFSMILNLSLKVFGCHKSNGAAKQPILFHKLHPIFREIVCPQKFTRCLRLRGGQRTARPTSSRDKTRQPFPPSRITIPSRAASTFNFARCADTS